MTLNFIVRKFRIFAVWMLAAIALVSCAKDEEMVIAVGDQVLYGKYAGSELEFEGEKYLIMRQSDVLAILG